MLGGVGPPQKVLQGPDMGYGEHGANAVLSAPTSAVITLVHFADEPTGSFRWTLSLP